MYHLLVSAVLIISCCTPSLGRYLGHTPYRPQPYNPYRNYHYPSPIGYPYHMPTSYYPAGTYFDQRRGILRPFPGGGVPIIVDYHKRCTGNYVGLKPHPEEGQYYYVCKQDCVIFGRCQKYQKFNTTCGQCVQQTPTEYEPKCTAEGRFPIHYDCHLYYKCDKSMQPQVYSCPHNMIFSQQTSKCIPGNRCIPTQIVSDDDSVPEYCENKYPACQQNGVFRSPSDCSLYYTCELQENRVFYQTRFKCPGDTFYDLQNNACLPREQVPCDCITLAELVYPPSYMQPYPPLIQPYPIVHDSEFDLDSLEEIEHATESSSEEDDEEGEELEEVDDSHEEFDDPYNSESSSSEEDASEDKKGQLAKERTTTTTVFPVATTLPTTESSAETTTETSEEQSTETTTEFATETPAAFTESPTEGPTEAATETTTEAVTEVPVEAISEVLPEVTTEAVVSTQIPESTTEAVVSTAVAADPTVAPVVSTVSPSPTDDDENDDIDILGSDVDFGDRFVLQDDKIWDNDGPGKTIFLKLNPDPESEEQTKDNEHDSTESPSDQGTLTTEPESEETTTEPSQDDNDDEDDDTGEGNNNETGTEGSNQDTDETNNEAGGDGNESGNDNHESEEDGQGSGEGNKESGEGSNEAGENATEEPDVSHTSDDTTVAPTTAIGATNQAADDGDTETEPCDEIVTVKPPPCETEKANMPRLEIFVERPMDVRFVICPKSCTKDHKHNYDEQDNRAVHLKWYPNRSNQSMTLETSNRLKIDG
ncbi:uncharacterized protein LOC101895947 [Musca domestica]|uniref:Uncharacterized protein LOC101895947 n=1 Tax=Musca domestica TaxID=7370 RepID=A0A9J7DCJ6_MUSDO|nr:uncharacterized protein LOC101895947 [Musca domestica]